MLREQFAAKTLSWKTIGQQMQIQLDPLLQFLDSVDLIKRVLTLRLVLRPTMYEDLGYSSFQEMYMVTQPVSRETLDEESAQNSSAEQED